MSIQEQIEVRGQLLNILLLLDELYAEREVFDKGKEGKAFFFNSLSDGINNSWFSCLFLHFWQ